MNIGKQVAKGKFVKTAFNKDALVRHGVILGTSGSGKTGLGIQLLEQLAMDGVPIIAIDPKGDLGNILDVPLVQGGLPKERALAGDIQQRTKLKQIDASIYTPGVRKCENTDKSVNGLSDGVSGGKPLGIYGSSKESRSEFLKQVLSLAYGYEVNALATQYVFLEKELEYREKWEAYKEKMVGVDRLIRFTLNPMLKDIGGMPLDDYISENECMTLARKLTSLNESKDFQRWANGQLDIQRLLWNESTGPNVGGPGVGTPRLSIISIAHLSEADRKFFLPIFLSELVNTMRGWQGTDKLRAVLYIDECVGMLPPVSNPPTKGWLMTLLKQARAYGLGVVLATQNPADLDYRALGNVGSWWVGRLQTDRDREKVREAIRGSESGVNLGNLIGELEPRQFVQSVLGSSPVTVKSNDCLCSLSGPMTLAQIAERTSWRTGLEVEYKPGESEYGTYRRMLVKGAKCAAYSMDDELFQIREMEQGGLRNFLWRESIKPTLKKRLRMVQDDLMQSYIANARKQILKERVG